MINTVRKPWGYEYLLFQNSKVAIWHLLITAYGQTSLHSHPNKKTGLIVLDGAAKVSFLGNESKLFYGEKIMIRHGVFHRTQSMTPYLLQLLEIETPVNKEDIIRLDDAYGRAGSTNMGEIGVAIDPINIDHGRIGKCTLSYKKLNNDSFLDENLFDNFMITNGSVSHFGSEVAGPGDIISYNNFKTLVNKFKLSSEIEGLAIKVC